MKLGSRATDAGRAIPLTDPDSWSAALDGVPHAFAHTWANCRAMASATGSPTFLYATEQDGERAVCAIAERTFQGTIDVVTPFGGAGFAATGPMPDLLPAWRTFARERGWVCGYLQLHPVLETPFASGPLGCGADKESFVLDLRQPASELEARLAHGRRSALRAWERGEGRFVDDRRRIEAFGTGELPRFTHLRGGAVFSVTPEAWGHILDQPGTIAFGVEAEGELVAINVIVRTATTADGLFLVSRPGHEQLSTALVWEGIRRLQRCGVATLNLGAGVRAGDGVEAFKRSLGATPLPTRVLRQVYDEESFARLCEQAGVDPDQREGHFPPYRRPVP